MSKAFIEKFIIPLTFAMLTAAVSFLWEMSKSIQELNKQVAVVITQVSNSDDRAAEQKERVKDLEDQIRILNDRVVYITRYVNDEKLKGNQYEKDARLD